MSRGLTLGDTLSWPARYFPDKPALIAWEGGDHDTPAQRRVWTYAQLNAEVNRHAHALLALGVQKGDVVAAFLYNTPAFVFSLLAAARVGAVFNPINYRLAAQELAFILEDGQAKVLLFEKDGSEVVEKAREHGVPTAHWIYADPDAAPAFATAKLDELVQHQPATLPPVI
ncbi:MAG: long-chain fatty acid--CoA ligase, partial [Azospira oryzae]